jgi:hypothetical protein
LFLKPCARFTSGMQAGLRIAAALLLTTVVIGPRIRLTGHT